MPTKYWARQLCCKALIKRGNVMFINSLLFLLFLMWAAWAPSAFALTNADVALNPMGLTEARAKPKVILSVDTSGSMNSPAYAKTYNSQETYVGIFDEKACYLYDDTIGHKYFYRVKNSATGAGCMGWNGSFLNWLTMRRIDILREILIGSSVEIQTLGGTPYTRRDAFLQNIKASKNWLFIAGKIFSFASF